MAARQSQPEFSRGKATEIGVAAEGFLPNILIQHLFTSFIWAIVEHLPENCLSLDFNGTNEDKIEGHDRFYQDSFHQTWYLPKLSHEKLTETVRQIESYGMGSKIDILLCLIPALSFKDLLPNHAILQLIPPFSKNQGWAATARCYTNLMATSLRNDKPEILCFIVAIHTMDFLHLAYQPYDKFNEPPKELDDELKSIVRKLGTSKFAQVVRTLVPMHNLQGRRATFDSIFGRYMNGAHASDGSREMYRIPNTDIDEGYPKKSLGFSEPHEKVYLWLKGLSVS